MQRIAEKSFSRSRVITYSGVLTALGLLLPLYMPRLGVPPILTVTPLSHLPLMLAMFVHPVAALCTYLGTTVGFFITSSPFVGIRAASHLPFVLFGLLAYSKGWDARQAGAYIVAVIMSLIHAASEAIAALVAVYLVKVEFTNSSSMVMPVLIIVSFLAFFAHSMFDWFFAYNIKKALVRLRMV